MKVTVTKYLNVRVGKPSLNAPCYQYIAPGSELEVEDKLYTGDLYDGIDTWLKDEAGNYYWSEGVSIIQNTTKDAENTSQLNVKIPATIDWNKNFLCLPNIYALTKGKGITIAIIDSGVDISHPNLLNSNISRYDFTNSQAKEDDEIGHGTALAGILVGKKFNDQGISGVANEAKIISLKIQSKEDTITTNYEERIANALDFLLKYEEQIHIINLSLSCSNNNRITDKLGQLQSTGSTIIASAFNQRGWNNNFYPANLPISLAVASVNEFNLTTSPNEIFSKADAVGPFVSIDTCSIKENGYFSKQIGCSFSTAYISGCVALIFSKKLSIGVDIKKIYKKELIIVLKECCSQPNQPNLFNSQFFGFTLKK